MYTVGSTNCYTGNLRYESTNNYRTSPCKPHFLMLGLRKIQNELKETSDGSLASGVMIPWPQRHCI